MSIVPMLCTAGYSSVSVVGFLVAPAGNAAQNTAWNSGTPCPAAVVACCRSKPGALAVAVVMTGLDCLEGFCGSLDRVMAEGVKVHSTTSTWTPSQASCIACRHDLRSQNRFSLVDFRGLLETWEAKGLWRLVYCAAAAACSACGMNHRLGEEPTVPRWCVGQLRVAGLVLLAEGERGEKAPTGEEAWGDLWARDAYFTQNVPGSLTWR